MFLKNRHSVPTSAPSQQTVHFPRHRQTTGTQARCSQVPAIFQRVPLASHYENCHEKQVDTGFHWYFKEQSRECGVFLYEFCKLI